MQNKNPKAFTLVELIVVITILAILGTIAFISLQGYSSSARNSRRISDVNNIKTSLELFILNSGVYPTPDNYETVSYGGDDLRYQGIIGDNVTKNLSKNLPEKPTDPQYEIEYTYSITNTKKEYELLAFYEGNIAMTSPQPSPLRGEGVMTKLFNQANASTNITPKILGNYNQLYVKSANYIVPIPSIINAEVNGTGMILNENNIKSQILTEGENILNVNISGIETQTGKLKITLSVYTGSITKESTSTGKILAIEKIQQAYSGTTLSNNGIYKYILGKTSDEEKLGLAETVLLNNNFKFTTNDDGGEDNPIVNLCLDITSSIVSYWKFDDFSLDDDFTGTSINTSRWSLIDSPVQNEQLQTSKLITGQQGVSSSTKWELSGDFDIQVDYSNFVYEGGNSSCARFRFYIDSINWVYTSRCLSGTNSYFFERMINGVYSSNVVNTTNNNGILKIKRIGNTISSFYGTGTTWTQIGTGVSGFSTNNGFVDIFAESISNQDISVKFDNFKINKGELAQDTINSNTGVIDGANWTTGKIGNALSFDGVDDYVEVEDDGSFDLTDELTIAAWIKPGITFSSGMPNIKRIISRQYGTFDSYNFLINTDGKLLMGSNGGNIQSTKNSWNQDEWYFIVGTYRNEEGIYSGELYVNGIKETLSVNNYDGMTSGNNILQIARRTDYTGDFNGKIDDVVIFNRALTQDEITKIYNDGLSGNTVCGY